MGRFGTSIAALAGPVVAAFSFSKVIDETKEAQAALAQLSVAYQKSGESAKRSKQEIIDFSDSAQRATVFSDEAVTRAQTTLLRFGRVTGQVFDRARQTILDTSAALGTDLETAAFTVGRALESPAQGLRQLRSLGIIFTESQQNLIKSLEESGKRAEAQNIILKELESRYSGAASAARNTLAGALAALKNAFDDLFESTDEGASKAAEGLNEITKVISDPQFKASIQGFIGESLKWLAAFANLIGKSIEGWQFLLSFVVKETPSAIDQLYKKQSELGASLDRAQEAKARTLSAVERANAQRIIDRAKAEFKEIERQIESLRQGQGGAQGIGSRQVSKPGGTEFKPDVEAEEDLSEISEVRISARKKEVEGLTKLFRQFEEETRGANETARAQLEETRAKLLELFNAGLIDDDTYAERLKDARIKFEEAVTIDPVVINASKKVSTVLTGQRAAIKETVDTLKQGLANLAMSGELTGRALLRYLLSALQSKVLMKAIEALGAALSKALNKKVAASGGGGVWGGILSGIFSAFSAGGGRTSGPRVVGEEGPELLLSNGTVMNRRQLAFAMGGGGGSNITMGNTTIIVQGNADAQALRAMEARMAQRDKKMMEALNQRMKDNYGRALR